MGRAPRRDSVTRPDEVALRVALLCEVFPALGETFVQRQVAFLGADVLCAVDKSAELKTDGGAASIRSLSRNTPFDILPGWHVGRRILARLFGEPAPAWTAEAGAAFTAALDEMQPDVVLVQFGQNAVRAREQLEQTELPVVVQFFGQDASALLRRKRYVAHLPGLFERAASVVVMGRDMGDRLEAVGCPADKIHVIPVGVPIDDLPVAERVGAQPCRFVAAHRWVGKKGVIESLEALARCRRDVPDVSLDLVGGGPLEGRIREFIAGEELGDAVRLHGSMPNADLHARLISKAGCLIQHSRTAANGDREGWPVVIAEAAAAGLPVVSTRHAAIPEQVLDGTTGFLVAEGDVGGMADAMIRLARDPELREQMGQAARAHTQATGALPTQLARLREVLVSASRR